MVGFKFDSSFRNGTADDPPGFNLRHLQNRTIPTANEGIIALGQHARCQDETGKRGASHGHMQTPLNYHSGCGNPASSCAKLKVPICSFDAKLPARLLSTIASGT